MTTQSELQSRRRELKAQEKAENQVELVGRKGDRYWTEDEHDRFIEAVKLFGKDWAKITAHVGTRSRQSVYSHAQKFRKRVEREPNL